MFLEGSQWDSKRSASYPSSPWGSLSTSLCWNTTACNSNSSFQMFFSLVLKLTQKQFIIVLTPWNPDTTQLGHQSSNQYESLSLFSSHILQPLTLQLIISPTISFFFFLFLCLLLCSFVIPSYDLQDYTWTFGTTMSGLMFITIALGIGTDHIREKIINIFKNDWHLPKAWDYMIKYVAIFIYSYLRKKKNSFKLIFY